MNRDRSLLFAVLALHADYLDADQFIKACMLWATRKKATLPNRLIELDWMTETERLDVERLLERMLKNTTATPEAAWLSSRRRKALIGGTAGRRYSADAVRSAGS